MWELEYKGSWTLKNWCFWTVVLEKTLESLFNCKEIQSVHPKGNQSWYSLEGLMLKLKLQYFGHLMRRTESLKRPFCWEILKAGEKGQQGMRWLDGITDSMDMSLRKLWELWWTGSLVCWSLWGCKELDRTEWLNWADCACPWIHPIFQFSSVAQSGPTLCDPMDCSMPDFPVHHQLLELAANSCPSSQLCHPSIFSSCLQSFPSSGSFPMSQFFTSGGQSIGASASASVLPMNSQDWFPLWLTGLIFLHSKGLSRVFPNTTVQNNQFFGAQLSLWSNPHLRTWLLKKS